MDYFASGIRGAYTVAAAGLKEFTIEAREDSAQYDRFVLHKTKGLTGGQLDALTFSDASVQNPIQPPPPPPTFFQSPGADYMAFEAETGSITDTDPGVASIWQVVDNPSNPGDLPSEGFILRPTENATPGTPPSTATYELGFSDDSAPYHLYVRHKRFGDGSSDSLFTPDDFGEAPGFVNRNGELNGPTDVYQWWESPDTYTVGDVGTLQTFVMGSREVNMGVDRIVLSQQAGLSNAELDALSNSPSVLIPEPSTFLLAALGLLGMLGLRRQRRRT